MVKFKLGRKVIVYLLVDCYEVEKKKKKLIEKERKKIEKLWKRKTKRVWNNVVLNKWCVLVWNLGWRRSLIEIVLLETLWVITPLGLGKCLFQLALELITCLLTKPHYNLEKPLWFLPLYFQYEFLDECII